jgi:hypothetical protein
MTKKAEITEAQWLNEMAMLSKKNDEGLTVRELCEKSGHDGRWVCDRLRKLLAEGSVVLGHKTIFKINGAPYTTPCYRFVKKEAK